MKSSLFPGSVVAACAEIPAPDLDTVVVTRTGVLAWGEAMMSTEWRGENRWIDEGNG